MKVLVPLFTAIALAVAASPAIAEEQYYAPVPGYACQIGALAPGWGVQYDANWKAINFVREFGGKHVRLNSKVCVTVVVRDGGGFAGTFVRAPRWMHRWS